MRVTGSLRRQEKNPEHRRKAILRSRDPTSSITENTREKERPVTGLGLVYRFDGKKWRKLTSDGLSFFSGKFKVIG